MIAYVDMENPKLVYDPARREGHEARREQTRQQIERTTGVPCTRLHYTEFSCDWAEKNGIRALMLSGQGSDWEHYDWSLFAPLEEVIHAGETPTFGLCGGHQFVAMTFGGEVARMGELPPGVEDPQAAWGSAWSASRGMKKESGVLPVRIVKEDPVLEGLASPFMAWHSHYWEVKRLPPGFEILASSDMTRVQMMRHPEKPWYGTQFHPEQYKDDFPDGARILQNFCRIYGIRS